MLPRFPSSCLRPAGLILASVWFSSAWAGGEGSVSLPAAPPSQGLWEAGGVFFVLVLLVALGLAGLAVSVTLQLTHRRWMPEELRENLRDLFQQGHVQQAGVVAERDPSLLGQLVARWANPNEPEEFPDPDAEPEGPEAKVERCMVGVTAPLARAVNFCSSIMLMGPMLGLLAVVGGTIRAVDSNIAGTTGGHLDLAAGIANASKVALVGGVVGLGAFLLLLVFKRRFRSRTEELRGTMLSLVSLIPDGAVAGPS